MAQPNCDTVLRELAAKLVSQKLDVATATKDGILEAVFFSDTEIIATGFVEAEYCLEEELMIAKYGFVGTKIAPKAEWDELVAKDETGLWPDECYIDGKACVNPWIGGTNSFEWLLDNPSEAKNYFEEVAETFTQTGACMNKYFPGTLENQAVLNAIAEAGYSLERVS